MRYYHSICWLRRDLRLKDHAALAEATRSSDHVTLVFVFDTTILGVLQDKDDRRVFFIVQSLLQLDEKIRSIGSVLIVRHGDPVSEIPRLVKDLKADALFFGEDYEPPAKTRDEKIRRLVSLVGAQCHSVKDQVIFRGTEVQTAGGTPYRVFTPYRNAWLARLHEIGLPVYKEDLRKLTPIGQIKPHWKKWSLETIGFQPSSLWLEAGYRGAEKRLRMFRKKLDHYAKARDFPSVRDGTSGFSVHLRFGTISIRSLVRLAQNASSASSKKWLDELIWRDFYQMILDCYPHVSNGAFKPEYDAIEWPGEDEHFEAWKEGKTGYPLIDAAMRKLNATGWMHNRLRMVVASFLVKDLLVDWRKGESWFARRLLDFDLAANNGGWQWCASTGCDSQPYFRIFNPTSQSKKFDPEGIFIREMLPELARLPIPVIHTPWLAKEKINYPRPIVDHAVQRNIALALYKKARASL